jgi:hypothetical protein
MVSSNEGLSRHNWLVKFNFDKYISIVIDPIGKQLLCICKNKTFYHDTCISLTLLNV